MIQQELLTIPEAAQKHELNLSIPRVYQLIRTGKIKVVKVNQITHIPRDEITRFKGLERPPGRPRKLVHIPAARPTIYNLEEVANEDHEYHAQLTASGTDDHIS